MLFQKLGRESRAFQVKNELSLSNTSQLVLIMNSLILHKLIFRIYTVFELVSVTST